MKKIMNGKGIICGISLIVIFITLFVTSYQLIIINSTEIKYKIKNNASSILDLAVEKIEDNNILIDSAEENGKTVLDKTIDLSLADSNYPSEVAAGTSSMSTIVKKSSRKYLFGGGSTQQWTGYYSGGTNAGAGSTTITDSYLQCSTWGIWTSYTIKTVVPVDLTGYTRIAYEYESITRSRWICRECIWTSYGIY